MNRLFAIPGRGLHGSLWALVISVCLIGACETNVRLGSLTDPCEGKSCGDNCNGITGEEVCNAAGACTIAFPACNSSCEAKSCGDPCIQTDGISGSCDELGYCQTEPAFCSCLGFECGAPCFPCDKVTDGSGGAAGAGATAPCVYSSVQGYCHAGGRCLQTKPSCAPQTCGSGNPSCEDGDYCCNRECGTCSAVGAYCDPYLCTAGDKPCGPSFCAEADYCCDPNCGVCAPAGLACESLGCDSATAWVPCGDNICPPGLTCCNPSCGICAGPGESCPSTKCATVIDCGTAHCKEGEVCCNASCGICVPKGGDCPTTPCD